MTEKERLFLEEFTKQRYHTFRQLEQYAKLQSRKISHDRQKTF